MAPTPPLDEAACDRLLRYHSIVTTKLASNRTALRTPLIPVNEYVAYVGVEQWRRFPEVLAAVSAEVSPEELAQRLRTPGWQNTSAGLSSICVVTLGGREFERALGIGRQDEHWRVATVLDWHHRFLRAWRGDGFYQNYDAGEQNRAYPRPVVDRILDGAVGLDDEGRADVQRFCATLAQYLFLLFLETRWGTNDTGPYPLPDGRTLVVREFSHLGESFMWWADGGRMPYGNLVAGLVFQPGVQTHIIDWGSSHMVPANFWDLLSAFSLFSSDGRGNLTPVGLEELPAITAGARAATRDTYRTVASWTWEEKVLAGSWNYFRGHVLPITTAAGVDDRFDWTWPDPDTRAAFLPLLEHMPPPEDAGSGLLEVSYTPLGG
jgi:hypothetical protein